MWTQTRKWLRNTRSPACQPALYSRMSTLSRDTRVPTSRPSPVTYRRSRVAPRRRRRRRISRLGSGKCVRIGKRTGVEKTRRSTAMASRRNSERKNVESKGWRRKTARASCGLVAGGGGGGGEAEAGPRARARRRRRTGAKARRRCSTVPRGSLVNLCRFQKPCGACSARGRRRADANPACPEVGVDARGHRCGTAFT